MATPITIDAHILINLNRELKNPFAFVVYLHLWSFDGIENTPYFLSHQTLADSTGLSKSAIQKAVRFLEDKRLVAVTRLKKTSEPGYVVKRPWADGAKSTEATRSKKIESFAPSPVSVSHPKKEKRTRITAEQSAALKKLDQQLRHKEDIFKSKLSLQQQSDFIADYKRRLGPSAKDIDEKTIRNLAIDQWYKLLPK